METTVNLQTFYKNLKGETVLPTTEASHFNIIRAEDTLISTNRPVVYSRRSFFKVSIIKGRSRIHYADQSFEIEQAVVFTNPLIPFHWELLEPKQVGFVCLFTEDFFGKALPISAYPVFQRSDAAIVPLDDGNYRKFHRLFSKAFAELNGSYRYKYDLLRNQVMEIVHEAQKLQPALGAPAAIPNASERIASLFMELLNRQFPIEFSNQTINVKTPAGFAARLNIHINHLNKALKDVTGHTTSQLIQDRLLNEAKVLLKSTPWSINEIAWCLGFEEPNHFSAFFKSRLAMSPKTFRQTSLD